MFAAVAASPVLGAPCSGFSDVEDDGPNGFCPSVDWMKNRGVTSGCGGSTFCPNAPVSRLAMAAFMKRLGEHLAPTGWGSAQDRQTNVNLDTVVRVCGIGMSSTNYPRTVYLDAQLSATALSDLGFAADLAVSLDQGFTWTRINVNPNRVWVPANQWGNASDTGVLDIPAGQAPEVGLLLARRSFGGTVNPTEVNCRLRHFLFSRSGTGPPY